MKKWYMTWMVGDVAVIPTALLAIGLVLGIIGLVIFNHSDQLNNACNSTLGQLGQGFDSNAAQQCTSASHKTTAGAWLAVIGLVSVIVGGRTLRNSVAIVGVRNLARRSQGA
jgi:ABC-type polysaccharide transport system permease subunit